MKKIKEWTTKQLENESLELTTDTFDVDILYADYGKSVGYVDDVINDIADAYLPIYDAEFFEKIEDLYHNGFLDRAITEQGASDMSNILIGGYHLYLVDTLYENIDTMIRCYTLNTLQDYEEVVSKEEFEDILDMLDDINHQDIEKLSDINDTIDNVVYDVLSDRED